MPLVASLEKAYDLTFNAEKHSAPGVVVSMSFFPCGSPVGPAPLIRKVLFLLFCTVLSCLHVVGLFLGCLCSMGLFTPSQYLRVLLTSLYMRSVMEYCEYLKFVLFKDCPDGSWPFEFHGTWRKSFVSFKYSRGVLVGTVPERTSRGF